MTAAHIGLDGAAVAHFERRGGMIRPASTGSDLQHFNAQLVAQDAGIGKKGLPAGEGVQIGAADADAADAHQHLARRGPRRRHVGCQKLTRLF